jgi:hypothetical protein
VQRFDSSSTPWLNVRDAAARARCGTRQIRIAVRTGKLRAAMIGGHRELRFLAGWIDDYLIATTCAQSTNGEGR